MNSKRVVFVVVLVALTAPVWALGGNLSPALVSPGATKAAVEIGDRCPTFSWGASPPANAFELIVYQLPDESLQGAAAAEPAAPVLRVSISGAAGGWTPSLDQCFEPGQSYAWTLRSLQEGAPSPWAEPRLFTIHSAPSASDVRAALQVLNLYLEDVQKGEAEPVDLEVASQGPETLAPDARSTPRASGTERSDEAPVGTGIAAIRGEAADPTGETYGAEGISNSPDGAGLSAENTTHATDLRLQGNGVEPDAELTESAIDRPSDSAQTFDIRNSGAGTMTLQVDGTEVVTMLTDADTLAGLGCASTEIAKWNGSNWVCSPDDNDDSLGELTCDENQVPQWNGSAWVCANTGTDTLGSLSCGAGQVVHFNGSVWVCGQPTLVYATCSSSNSCSATCPAGSIVWTGGCTATPSSATLVKSTPTGNPPTGWSCSAFNPIGAANVTVDLFCVSQ